MLLHAIVVVTLLGFCDIIEEWDGQNVHLHVVSTCTVHLHEVCGTAQATSDACCTCPSAAHRCHSTVLSLNQLCPRIFTKFSNRACDTLQQLLRRAQSRWLEHILEGQR
jgi:hypothetical protein